MAVTERTYIEPNVNIEYHHSEVSQSRQNQCIEMAGAVDNMNSFNSDVAETSDEVEDDGDISDFEEINHESGAFTHNYIAKYTVQNRNKNINDVLYKKYYSAYRDFEKKF